MENAGDSAFGFRAVTLLGEACKRGANSQGTFDLRAEIIPIPPRPILMVNVIAERVSF